MKRGSSKRSACQGKVGEPTDFGGDGGRGGTKHCEKTKDTKSGLPKSLEGWDGWERGVVYLEVKKGGKIKVTSIHRRQGCGLVKT